MEDTASTISISDLYEFVKTYDKEFSPKAVNKDGTYLDVELGNSIRLDANFVASAYGRNTKALIEYAINNNEVLFYAEDKKRVSSLLATHGLQLPARLSTTNSTNIIPDSVGKSNSISEKSAKDSREARKNNPAHFGVSEW